MNQEKIWDHFQNNNEAGPLTFKSNSRYQFIANQISPGTDVLNIGVGRGGLESLLISKGVNAYSLDPSEESIEFIRSELGLADRARPGYSQEIPFGDRSFDVVVMSEVLEHLNNDVIEKTLAECRRVLRAGGAFIGTVPADESLAASIVVCPCCGEKFHRWGHVQEFSEDKLGELLGHNFAKYKIGRKYFGSWDSLNFKGKVSFVLKNLLSALGVKGSGENFYFVANTTE